MEKAAVRVLCEVLVRLTELSIENAQKLQAVEILLKKNLGLEEAYRQEIARTKAQEPKELILIEIRKLQSALDGASR